MLSQKFQLYLGDYLDIEIVSISSVSGGDINDAWKLKTRQKSFFLKTNTIEQSSAMFVAEATGLKHLRTTQTILIPEVVALGSFDGHHFLALDFISETHTNQEFWSTFGEQLASLHSNTSEHYGLDSDNFIGSLHQSNCRHKTWPEFYALERLFPQAELASSKQLLSTQDRTDLEALIARLPELLPAEKPALIHGDLWSGNFLCTEDHTPVLVDPAVYYGHREMDLAMSRLFGGFHRDFYRSYEKCTPLSPGFEGRLRIYQLYYLLVHLNLFGQGYYNSVRRIIQEFGTR